MWEILGKWARMFHFVDVDYDMKPRVPLKDVWTGRLDVPIMLATSKLLHPAPPEGEKRLDTRDKIRRRQIWEVTFPQA